MQFKKEFKQLNHKKDDDKSENACQNAWSKLSRENKKVYNINAQTENKAIKECLNKLKNYHKKKEDKKDNDNINEEKVENKKKEKEKEKRENDEE